MEILDSRQLRAFVILARTGSFTLCARELNLTQSAISHAIKSLEADIGVRLFDRDGKKITLSPHGKRFIKYAEAILEQMNIARTGITTMEYADRGRLRIGCSGAGAQFILPPVLREFRECFPKFDIAIQTLEELKSTDLLDRDSADILIGVKGPSNPRHKVWRLFTDELFYLVSPLHPWAGRAKPPGRSELKAESYILYQNRTVTYELIAQHFLKLGVTMRSLIDPGTVETMKELTRMGLGVGIAAPWVAKRELDERSLVAVPIRPAIKREWIACNLKTHTLNLAEEVFLGLVRDFSAQFNSPEQ